MGCLRFLLIGFIVLCCIILAFVARVYAQDNASCTEDRQELLRRKEAFRQQYRPGQQLSTAYAGIRQMDAAVNMLVFWKTDCPHCKQLVGLADSLLGQSSPQRFQVLAVCLDADTATWRRHPFVAKPRPGLRHYCDGLGYAGPVVAGYHVYATPTMLLFDGQRRLLPLPKSVQALKELVLRR